MRVQARFANPDVKDKALMVAASKLIAVADGAWHDSQLVLVNDDRTPNDWLAAVAAQNEADRPPGWVEVVCIAGSPWFDPSVN